MDPRDALCLPRLSPREALRRLRAAGLPGLALLESAGPVTAYSRYSFLSAAPTRLTAALPERPDGRADFPAWIGGLKYEAASDFGLPAQAGGGPVQLWGYYPSGLVWDRQENSLQIAGEAHLAWHNLLSLPEPAGPTLTLGHWSEDDIDFEEGVLSVQELIRAGEVYQVNLSRGVRAPAGGDPLAAYLKVAQLNPSPFMAYLELGDEVVVSASPERLVQWLPGEISARPIAGTRRRGDCAQEDEVLEAELRASSKEQAEHIMLLDLVRHDLGRAARAGSVWVPDLMLVERYSHVMHLVSEVRAEPLADLSVRDLCEATFPGGTITGAPKRRVMQAISELEPTARGWYTGSVGLISAARVDLNILIRTAAFVRVSDGWEVTVRAGAGVVIDSSGPQESRETAHKAAALLQALTPGLPGRAARSPELPRPGRVWRPTPTIPASSAQSVQRVLFLDNFDSFTYNLVHDLRALGCEVIVRSADSPLGELLALSPSHLVIGPGPGTPQTSGVTLDLVRHGLACEIPLLGVCLGHQALGAALGARVERARIPVHGRPATIRHDGSGIFAGIEQDTEFTRYHSLVLRQLPSALRVTARSADGEVMGIAVSGKPAWGVQFHPESVLSREGRQLLGNFLRLGEQWVQGSLEHAAR